MPQKGIQGEQIEESTLDLSSTDGSTIADVDAVSLLGQVIGTSANNLVQLNGSAQLPAVDGSLLTNLPPSGIASVAADLSPQLGANLDAQSFKITALTDPTAAQEAATKAYVDAVAQGLAVKPAVRAATTANLTATYDNGTLGVGATLTATTNVVWPGVDTVTTGWALFDGVLIKDQTNAAHNGRYYVSDLGSVGVSPWILTRCTSCDEADEIPSSYMFVQEGSVNIGIGYAALVGNPATFVVGTDDITWTQFSSAGAANNWLTANNGSDFTTAPIAGGTGGIAIGNAANGSTGAIGSNTVAIGTSATALYGSIAIGKNSEARCTAYINPKSVAIGEDSYANSNGGIAIGDTAVTGASYSIAIGRVTVASGSGSIAIGDSADATIAQSVAIGENALASVGAGAIALGNNSDANNAGAVALGQTSLANGVSSITVGKNSQSTLTEQLVLGANIQAADVTSDVAYSAKIGNGNGVNTNLIHLHTKGHLQLVGTEAQIEVPGYATAAEPANPVEGSLIYDTTLDALKTYDGAAWNTVGGGGGGVANPLTADLDTGGYSIITASSAVLNAATDNIIIQAGSHYHRNASGADFGNIDIIGGGNAGYVRAGTISITGGAGSTWSAEGGNINLTGGASSVAKGGDINIISGNEGTALPGGNVNITGASTTGSATLPGNVAIEAGSGIGKAGNITIQGGFSNQKNPTNGGDIDILAGGNLSPGGYTYAGQRGGNILIQAGEPNVANVNAIGGNVILKPGSGGSTAGPGAIQIASAAGNDYAGFDILDDVGSYKTTVKVAPLSANTLFQLPNDNGTADYLLRTDGSGVTSWVAAPAGGGGNWLTANNGADFTTAPISTGANAIALGNSASTSTFANSIAIGTSAVTAQIYEIAIGNGATTGGAASLALGFSANGAANSTIAIGGNSDALANSSIAIGRETNARSASDIVMGEYTSTGSGGLQSIVIGRAATTSTGVDNAVVIGSTSNAAIDKQVVVGPYLGAADVTSDVAYSVKLGHGSADANKNMLHLFDAGKLELYGAKAQFIIPNYATAGEPANPLSGSLIYDSTLDALKTYDGANWKTIANEELVEYSETANAIATTGAVTIDLTTGTYFYNTATTGAITFTFSNPAASGRVSSFTLELFGGGTNAPVWPASVEWPGGTEPTWSTGKDVVSFSTRDGGTTWLGMLGGTAFA